MIIEDPKICTLKHLNDSYLFIIFRMIPLLSIPSYILAWILITRNKSKAVQAVKKKYLRQMIINYISVALLCIIVCPVLIPPIPGYFMMGLMAYDDSNVALPLVAMTHMVLIVALAIMQLFKHQLVTLSDVRYTRKFELPVKIIKWLYMTCYIFSVFVAISIFPALTIEFELEGFRRAAFEYFQNPICLCSDMFIADPRQWKIYVPYFLSISFGILCSVTGVSSVITCLKMIYDSRKMVSRETLIMQRNFTFILMYQAIVCIVFVIMPLVSVSTLFYADISISENGLYYLLVISSQGSINNMVHIVPGLWRKLRKKKRSVDHSRQSWKGSAMWSTSVSHVTSC